MPYLNIKIELKERRDDTISFIVSNIKIELKERRDDTISFIVSNCHKPCLPELNAHWLTLCI